MAEQRVTRRLAAILAADVVGYSRLTGVDEEGTVSRLRALRQELINPVIAANGGRTVKLMGDGTLVEFGSVVGAVRCAIEVQSKIAVRNIDVVPDKRIEFRVGIHLGDVLVESDGDLMGDGVNIAARLEGIAEPGGICLSNAAYEQVRGKIAAEFIDLGEQSLKNIAHPVRAYRVEAGLGRATEPTASAPPLPDKPSIAVLPFQNMSGDPEQEYFADGVVEDIITALSRLPWLFVIARNSSFIYKGRAVDVKQVGRELGIRYVLEGSIRRAANRVRITGQLIDCSSSAHIWADRFDGSLDDVFELQDQITASVAGALEPAMRQAEMRRVTRKPTGSLDAYDCYLHALGEYYSFADRLVRSLSYCRRSIAADPRYSSAYGLSAYCAATRRVQGWMERPEEECRQGLEDVRHAIEFGSDDPEALVRAGHAIGMLSGEHDRGTDVIERALFLNPNAAQGWSALGWLRVHFDPVAALEPFERAMRLSPRDPLGWQARSGVAWAHFLARHYDEALREADRALHEQPRGMPALTVKIAACGFLGRIEEGQAAVRTALAIDPATSVSKLRARAQMPEQNLAIFVEGWRKAEMPE